MAKKLSTVFRTVFRPELAHVAGLAFLASGAWLWLGTAAGLAAIGVALLLLGWMLED